MLIPRIITALILTAFAVLLIFYVPTRYFALITALFLLVGAWEWSRLAGLNQLPFRVIYCAIVLAAFTGVTLLPVIIIMAIASVFWILGIVLVISYPKTTIIWSSRLARCVMGLLVIVPAWLAINTIHASVHGPWILLFMMTLVCAADIGAYFAGRWWGKHKLMPKVSPGKTWQGFLGGLLFSLLVAMIGTVYVDLGPSAWIGFMILVILLNVFSVTGDLVESMLKRYSQVKDSGRLFPGHGGVLDRLDSLMAVAPIFLLGLLCHVFQLS
jgi:phosphatidate cytidylyltransferase